MKNNRVLTQNLLMLKKSISFLLLLISAFLYSQQTDFEVRFVIEKGKFIFDKQGYLEYKKESDQVAKSLKMIDSLKNVGNNGYSFIDDRILEYPIFDSATIRFKNKLIEKIKVNAKTKGGENIFSLVIDEQGKPVKLYANKLLDKNIFRQIRKVVFSREFNKWKPAKFYGVKVKYIFKFKIITDNDFNKYNMKNSWAMPQDSNLTDF
ncbi:hypothetical protein [Chryseobacterium balustinum]|uniref:TonB C-terminal domain-containing protein n=2 Tax=Chryseobacterium balustinum TaxID=246 RepID=A0AAX2IQ46_9FLAO|nr:hypothetical protein [Chryseobacterium balustinum]SKB43108.1 hypothetical protein SAMN05421800_101709 [Chryseobacterium balustinum]SQA91913.1 Uncharacterised protein [Chryseobacterium balustinum]